VRRQALRGDDLETGGPGHGGKGLSSPRGRTGGPDPGRNEDRGAWLSIVVPGVTILVDRQGFFLLDCYFGDPHATGERAPVFGQEMYGDGKSTPRRNVEGNVAYIRKIDVFYVCMKPPDVFVARLEAELDAGRRSAEALHSDPPGSGYAHVEGDGHVKISPA
jgi:hypothetical protein